MIQKYDLFSNAEFGFIDELLSIPWGHNRLIITKCKEIDKALFYVRQTLENGWSRVVLEHQIEWGLRSRQALYGKIC